MGEEEGFNFLPPEGGDDALIPTSEPKLTQLDEASRRIILDTIYKYEWKRDPETGTLIKDRVKTIYPALEKALSYALSHLNMVIDIPFYYGEYLIEYWEGMFYNPLELTYEDDGEALYVLDVLDSVFRRNIMAAIDGSHQDYNVKMAGAHRVTEHRVTQNDR